MRLYAAVVAFTYSVAAAQTPTNHARTDAGRVMGTHPTWPLASYAGTYSDDAYGTMTVKLVNDTLRVTRGPLTGNLEHWNYDTFRVHWLYGKEQHYQLSFAIDGNGVPRSFTTDYLGDTVTFVRAR